MDVARVRADLFDEQQALDDVVARLADEQWRLPTPSPRWSVADQIAHLAFFDRAAATAILDPDTFKASVTDLWEAASRGDDAVDGLTLGASRRLAAAALLAAWRQDRAALAEAAAGLGDRDRVEWYGPSMGARSFLTARLMEVWAHGQDVLDALGAERAPTDRLQHVATLGYLTRGWSYRNRGLEVPPAEVRVVLDAPSGGTWELGPEDAPDRVAGPAADFCLVVTQRRHVDDTALSTVGDAARGWMLKAQAFAGPPTDGPPAGTRRRR